jgi:Na+/H+ antiporter NhaD/arsenite permease-like protein
VAVWAAGVILATVAAALRPDGLAAAARATAGPFATLAAIILASALAGRTGVFGVLARALTAGRGTAAGSAAAVLTFTALLSGLVNLDVAVVVAMPAALQTARRQGLAAGRLAVAVAITANATSFLLPTSNITSLLLLARRPLPADYLASSWLPWLLVTAVTIGPLTAWAARGRADRARTVTGGPSARAASGLLPMFCIASGTRALLGTGLALHGSLTAQLAQGSALAAAASNLPAAAALTPGSTAGLWAAILATAIGPSLLLTGSVATLICRRIARDGGTTLGAGQFTITGLLLVPAQLAAAALGLHLTGALS